jgi:two-component SAPR family response regulator
MGSSRKLTLRITGPLTVRGAAGGTVNLRGDHVRCLFILLACSEGQAARRAWLSDLLWHHDTDTSQARLGLRQLLHRLKQQLRPLGKQIDLVGADKDLIWLNSSHVWIDLREIESLLLLNSETALERALSLYGGPVFKNESHLTDQLEAHIARLNETLLAKLVKAAKVLLRFYQKEKLFDSALRVAETLAELAPLSAETQVIALETCDSTSAMLMRPDTNWMPPRRPMCAALWRRF